MQQKITPEKLRERITMDLLDDLAFAGKTLGTPPPIKGKPDAIRFVAALEVITQAARRDPQLYQSGLWWQYRLSIRHLTRLPDSAEWEQWARDFAERRIVPGVKTHPTAWKAHEFHSPKEFYTAVSGAYKRAKDVPETLQGALDWNDPLAQGDPTAAIPDGEREQFIRQSYAEMERAGTGRHPRRVRTVAAQRYEVQRHREPDAPEWLKSALQQAETTIDESDLDGIDL